MTLPELIAALEAAKADDQGGMVRTALWFARDQQWITQDAYERGYHMCDAGAYESAALSLVPDGAYWDAGHSYVHKPRDCYESTVGHPYGHEGHAKTPALALCIAALKARLP